MLAIADTESDGGSQPLSSPCKTTAKPLGCLAWPNHRHPLPLLPIPRSDSLTTL